MSLELALSLEGAAECQRVPMEGGGDSKQTWKLFLGAFGDFLRRNKSRELGASETRLLRWKNLKIFSFNRRLALGCGGFGLVMD